MKLNVSLTYLRVVVIAIVLGVLAEMVGPQSSDASIETSTTKLIQALIDTRSNLDIYRAQHDGQLPPTDCCEEFASALTERAGQYGPYMKRIPVNPFNGLDEVRFDGEPAGANKARWRLDTETGDFQADNHSAYAAL